MTFKYPVIFLTDRGYLSFNVFEHLQCLQYKYVIRCKDVKCTVFLRKSNVVPDTDEFDIIVSLKLTNLQTKTVKEGPSFRFSSTKLKLEYKLIYHYIHHWLLIGVDRISVCH